MFRNQRVLDDIAEADRHALIVLRGDIAVAVERAQVECPATRGPGEQMRGTVGGVIRHPVHQARVAHGESGAVDEGPAQIGDVDHALGRRPRKGMKGAVPCRGALTNDRAVVRDCEGVATVAAQGAEVSRDERLPSVRRCDQPDC